MAEAAVFSRYYIGGGFRTIFSKLTACNNFHSPLCTFFSLGGGVESSLVAERAAFLVKVLQEGFPNTARISPVHEEAATELIPLNLLPPH